MNPIEIIFPPITVLGIRAITLWPCILYVSQEVKADLCIRAHEMYHWHQALRWGILPWYVAYLVIGLFYIGKPANAHPLEREAYRIQRECERSSFPG